MHRSLLVIGLIWIGGVATAIGGTDVRETSVRRLIGQGRYAEGFEKTAAIIDVSSNRVIFYKLLAETGQYSGRVREADSILTLCARKGWGVPEALLALGSLDAHRACWLDAYAHYQASAQVGGPSVAAFAGIQEMHEKLHGREAAISHLLALSHVKDRSAAVWYALALAYWSQWDLAQALFAVQQSLRSGATDPRVRYLEHAIRCARDPGARERQRLTRALRTAEAQGDWEGMAFLEWVCMNAFDAAGCPDSAEAMRVEGLRLARAFGLMGWKGHFLLQGGNAAFSRGEIAAAVNATDSAAACFRLAGEYDGILAAYSLRMSVLLESYRYPEALDYCFRMLQQIDGRSDPRLHAGAAIDAAWILSHIGGQRMALVLGIHAEGILEKMLYAAHDRCRLNATLAVIHASLGDTLLARRYAGTAAQIARAEGGDEAQQANCEGLLGDLMCDGGSRAGARTHYLAQWRLANQVSDLGERKSAARSLASLALDQGRLHESLRWTDSALTLARLSEDPHFEGEVHAIRARSMEAWGDRAGARAENDRARTCLRALRRLRVICSLTREMREWYLAQHLPAVRTLIRNGEVASATWMMAQARLDVAWPVSGSFAGGRPPDAIIARGAKDDRRALSAMIHRWIFSGASEDVAYSDTAIGVLGSFFAATVPSAREDDDEAACREGIPGVESREARWVKSALGRHEIAVDLLPGTEETDVFAITSDTIAHCRLDAGRIVLETLVDQFNGSVFQSDSASIGDHERKNLETVFAPLFSLVSRIRGSRDQMVIIGSGVQSQIPFEAIPWREGTQAGMLVDRFAVSYRPSIVLGSRPMTPAPLFGDRILIVGDPEIAVRSSGADVRALDPEKNGQVSGLLQSLPGTEEEIAVLKHLFGRRLDILRGEEATKGRFCAIATRYGIVHIATHGAARRTGHPDHVLFLSSARDGDGELRIEDILGLDFRGSLVVLPACLSARPSTTGDVESIAEAFLEAGASSVLAARWTVDDELSGEFVAAFYAALRAGSPRSTAVREAMRTVIAHGHRAPQVWAGFQLLGEGDERRSAQVMGETGSGWDMLTWMAGLAVASMILWFVWRRVRLRTGSHPNGERRE